MNPSIRAYPACAAAAALLLGAACRNVELPPDSPGPQPEPAPVLPFVDPFVGAGGEGFGVGSIFPGPTVPFGLVKLSPDTTYDDNAPGFSHCAGYWWLDPQIRGFSHTHLSGTGVADQGNIRLMPVAAWSEAAAAERGYRQAFSHATEEAAPGYYAVTLDESQVRVELTSSARCGLHRYTFPAGVAPVVVLDATTSIVDGASRDAALSIGAAGSEVEGWIQHHGPMTEAGYRLHFVASFSRPFVRSAVLDGAGFREGASGGAGVPLSALLAFDATDPVVEATVCLSYLDVAKARENRQADDVAAGFDEVRRRSELAWQALLGRVRVEGGTRDERVSFYTALYHAFPMPTDLTEAGGAYRGFDGQVHVAEGFRFHTDMSLWDTFRTLHPLWVFLAPDRQRDVLRSMLAMDEQSGQGLPKWPAATADSGTMIGAPADIVFADSYVKGLVAFDAQAALASMVATADDPAGKRGESPTCATYGYCPADLISSSVSRTQENSYADFAIATLARALGDEDTAARFEERAGAWKNLFDPATGFFRPRNADGAFVEPFDPLSFSDAYTEGDAWHYAFYPVFDPEGLAALHGEAFAERLDTFFRESSYGRPDDGIDDDDTLPDGYYWHGNEPDLTAPYLFHFAGRSDLTYFWARRVMAGAYQPAPDGLAGNDDGGTLSAWYVFSALGLFPIAGTDRYLLGSPLFTRAQVDLPGGTLVISAPAASKENLYVRRAIWNGAELTRPWLTHEELASGGELVFELAPAP